MTGKFSLWMYFGLQIIFQLCKLFSRRKRKEKEKKEKE
jgi:hypothetical protein